MGTNAARETTEGQKMDVPASKTKSSEIYTYEAEHPLFALGWSVRSDEPFRLAVGSFMEKQESFIDILQLDAERDDLVSKAHLRIQHPYPATKVAFLPDASSAQPDLLASSSDFLRIWKIGEESVTCDRLLKTTSATHFMPITSLDWNEVDTKRIVTASIDSSCTIWDVETGQAELQMVTHDSEIYDIAWGGVGIFASVSADGSARVFDVRDKEHSTIVYQSPGTTPAALLRLCWNKQDPRYLATLIMDSCQVLILDIRFPSVPIATLEQHTANVNALSWAPHSQYHICTAGDDFRALIWDLSKNGTQPLDPVLSYNAGAEVSALQWSSAHPDRVAICFGSSAQILRL